MVTDVSCGNSFRSLSNLSSGLVDVFPFVFFDAAFDALFGFFLGLLVVVFSELVGDWGL